MTDTPRFFEDLRITEELISFVGKNGGEKFFEKSSWKDTLDTRNESLTENKTHMRFESKDEQEDVLRYEFSQSKCLLESNLSNKTVSHFCYPWFQGSPVSDKIAHECGYQTVFYGLIPISKNHPRNMPIKIRRISEDFLFCLPGQGRAGYLSIWLNKVRKKMNVAG
jgi:hypothetical protein